MIIKMVIAGTNANGESDLLFCKVTVTEDDYNDGKHFSKAEEYAKEEGYEGPFVVFDEYSPPKPMFHLFVWKTATIVQ